MSVNGRFEYTIGFKTDDSGLKQAITALQKIQNITTDMPGFSNMSAEIAEARKGAFDLEQALTKAFNPKMGTVNTTALRNELSKLNLSKIRQDLMAMGPVGETAFNQLAASAMKANLQIKQSNSLLTKFGNTLYRNLEWLISGNIISTISSVFTKAYGFTKNLDSSLNDIRIVTGKSADEMARFGQEAQKTAMELGKGTTDITNASLIYFQQGLDEEEVKKRTEVTAKMANVTGQAAETVADQMTAVWNGFQAGNDELERYADIMTKVAASTASSSAELAGAISKTASIAKITGVDMEQLTSMISTVISVTRDSPETVGTAFKTIFARINDLVEDGTDEFGVSLSRVSSHLAAMGIEILDENGNLKDLGTTITETGEKWSFYTREQQIAIAEQMGGKRQWGQILALFDHWDDYKDTLLAATDATGSLNDQQEIYMDRVETHLQQVKTAWEGVYAKIFNEKDVIAVADAIKNVLEGVETFLDTVGGFKPVLDMVITMMMQAFGPKMAQEIDRTFTNIKGVFSNLEAETAQRDITLMFGNLGDKGLLSELVEHQKTMNRYKDQMNEKDREQYSNYLKQKIELNEQTKILDEQVTKAKEFAQARSEINNAYQYAGGFDTDKFSAEEEIENRLKTVQSLLQGSATDVSTGTFSLGTNLDAFNAEKEARANAIQDLITKLQAYKTEVEKAGDNEIEITRINKLMEALEGVKDKFSNAKTQTEEFKKELESSTAAAEKAATELQKVKSPAVATSTNRMDVLNEFAAGRGNSTVTQFRETNSKVLADTQADVATYRKLVQDLGNASVFSSEQVGKLNAALNNSSLNVDQIKESLRQELGVSEQGLENIMKVISQHSEGQLKVAEDTRKVLDDAQKSMEKSLSFRDQLTNLTRMASLASQMAMSFNQIQNIGRIIKDEDIKGSEKIGRVLSSIAMMLPMLMTTFSRLINSPMFSDIISNTKIIKDIANKRKEAIAAEYAYKQACEENFNAFVERSAAEAHYLNKKNAYEEFVQKKEQEAQLYEMQIKKAEGKKGKKAEKKLQDLKKEADAHKLNTQAAKEEKLAEMEEAKASRDAAIANQEQTTSEVKETSVKKKNTAETLELAESEEYEARIARKSAIYKTIAIGLVVATIAALIIAYKKIKEEQEKAEEAQEKAVEAQKKFIESNKELAKSLRENINQFGEFDELWKRFKEGKSTIEELTEGIDKMAEAFNRSTDPEYLRLKRIAEYTGYYEDIYNWLKNINNEENALELKTKYDNIDEYKKNITNAIPQEAFKANIFGQGENKQGIDIEEPINFMKILASNGIITDTNIKVSRYGELDYEGTIFNLSDLDDNTNYILSDISALWGEMDAKKLNFLIKNKNLLDEYSKSDNQMLAKFAKQVLSIISSSYSDLLALEQETWDTLAIEAQSSLSVEDGETEEEKAKALADQTQDAVKEAKKQFEKDMGRAPTEEESTALRTQILDIFANASPTNKQIAAIVQSWDQIFENGLEEGLNNILGERADLKFYLSGSVTLTQQDKAVIEKNLLQSGLDITKIDWAKASKDRDLMAQIIKTRGSLLERDIEKFKQYERETYNTTFMLSQDYDALIASWDNFNNKIEKNKFTKKEYNSKAFKEFFTDEVKDELISLYGATSDIGKAIDTLSNEAIVGSEKWKQAWGVFGDALKAAEIEADIKNVDQALEKIDNYLSIENKGDIHFLAKISVEQAEQDIDNFINADRTIDIDIETHIESAISELQESYKKLNEIGNKIGENLTVTSEELAELQKKFPEITQDMQLLSDGTIKLSQKAVDAAKQQAQQELLAETGFQIAKIELQKKLVEEKKKKYEEAAQIALENSVKVYTDEDRLQEDLNKLRDIHGQIETIEKKQGLAETIYYSDKEKKAWQKHYANLSAFDKEWHKTRIYNMEHEIEGQLKGKDEYLSDTKNISYFYKDYSEIQKRTEEILEEDSDAALKYYREQTKDLELDQNTIADYWTNTALANLRAANEEQNTIDAFTAQQKDLEDWANSYFNTFSGWDKGTKSIKDNTDAVKDNADAVKDNAEAQAELLDLLNEEIDAYHDVDLAIAKHTKELEKLQREQDKLTGDALIKNLEKQKELNNLLNQDTEERIRLMETEAWGYRNFLEKQGIVFDEEGYMTNYGEIAEKQYEQINKDIQKYNEMSPEDQEANKQWIEDRKQEYEDFKKIIEDYKKLKYPDGEVAEQLEKWEENESKQLELDITIVNTRYQFKLNQGEIKRGEIQLEKELQKVQDSDVLGNLTIDIKTLFTFDETGEGEQLKENFERFKEQYEYYVNNNLTVPKAIEEAYKTSLENWTQYVSERTQKIENIVTQSFDRLSKRLDRQKTQFETIDKIFEHDINLVKLRYGENAYKQLETLYKAREKVSKAQLENSKLQVQTAQEALREAQEKNLGEDIINDLEDKLAQSYESQREMLKSHLDFLKEQSEMAIDEIFDHLNKQLSGVSLDEMKNQWDWVNRDSDDYYDTVNAAYEIEKLRNKIKKAINETDDVSTQQALNNLMDSEIATLQQKDKLSKYDLERANALFDIEQKRAAFREAQNNKSKMRLRRDASGNYSYQFVSDEDKVTSAMQDLADAQNQLYNIDKEAYKNNLDKMYEYYVEYQEKMKNASTEEERQKIQEDYLQKLSELQSEYFVISNNLEQTALEARERLTQESLNNITEVEKQAILNGMVPMWSSALAQMMNDPNFIELARMAGNEVIGVGIRYNNEVDDTVQNITGAAMQDIIEGADLAVSSIGSMVESFESLNNTLIELVGTLDTLSTISLATNDGVQKISANEMKRVEQKTLKNINGESVSDNEMKETTSIQTWDKKISAEQEKLINGLNNSTAKIVYVDNQDPKRMSDMIDSMMFMSETVQFMADRLSRFYDQQLSILGNSYEKTTNSIASVFPMRAPAETITAPIYIDATFPAVNSSQEIKQAFDMLANQATQRAFSTLR